MSTSSDYSNILLDSIDMIVQDAISKAPFDRTIKGTVLRCDDETIGKYTIKYQDSTFTAYSTNTETKYIDDAYVYILIPNNDMRQTKTIIGVVNPTNSMYITTAEDDEGYEYIGKNCVEENNDNLYFVQSYKKGGDINVLYDINGEDTIGLNITDVNKYIKASNYLICKATFQTFLPKEQQYKGNYGIRFYLSFDDPSGTAQEISKVYTIDINDISIDDPYNLDEAIEEMAIFNLNNLVFKEITKIEIFAENFAKTEESSTLANDIAVSQIKIYGANQIEEIKGYNLSLLTPKGTYFTSGDDTDATLQINTQIKIKGKTLNSSSDFVKYYWFKENANITTANLKYNYYGGIGWECLNDYHVVEKDIATSEINTVEWIPGTSNITIKHSDIQAKACTYKCVAIYNNDIILSKIINIEDEAKNVELVLKAKAQNENIYRYVYNACETIEVECLLSDETVPDSSLLAWTFTNASDNTIVINSDNSVFTIQDNKILFNANNINGKATIGCTYNNIITNSITINYDAGSDSLYVKGTITQSSRKDIKTDFEELTDALSIINNTDIYKYHFRTEDEDLKKHIGFVIDTDETPEYNYDQAITDQNNIGADVYSMVSVCFKAIQELEERISELEDK